MENLILSVQIVLPLFLVMMVGYFCKHTGLINETLIKQMNSLVFRVFLPVLLCKNIYTSSLDSLMNPTVFVFAGVGIVVTGMALIFLVPRIEKDRRACGAIIQACFRSNYAYFGIPLVQAMFPGSDTSLASLLLVIVMPIYNVLAVVVLEMFRGGKVNMRQILKNIATNPLILGSLTGLVILLTGLKIPSILQSPIDDLSKIASPLALVLLGASINFSQTGSRLKQLSICVMGKLVIIPLVALLAARAMGMHGVELACMLIVFGSPAAVNSSIMAQQMDSDGELATQAVVFTTAFSALTMFMFVFLLKMLGWI